MHPNLQGFQPVTALMARIVESGNQYPRVRLAYGDAPLVLTLNGAKSKAPGAVTLTDGKPFGQSLYLGKITVAGNFEPAPAARTLSADSKAKLWAILARLKGGEAESVFAEHGKLFGVCCMCGRDLTNTESVDLGMGPICRERAFG